jgi:hypothetical protein
MTTIVSAPYKAIQCFLQDRVHPSICASPQQLYTITPLHTPQITLGQRQQYAGRQRKILTTEHPAAYLYNKFLDTIVKMLILNNIHVTGSCKTHKIVMTRY